MSSRPPPVKASPNQTLPQGVRCFAGRLFWREVALEGGYFEREVALQEGCFGGSLFRRKVVLEGEVVLKGSLFLKGHAFNSCRNFRKISRGFHRLQKQLGLLTFRGKSGLSGPRKAHAINPGFSPCGRLYPVNGLFLQPVPAAEGISSLKLSSLPHHKAPTPHRPRMNNR